ncbi:transposase [Actinocorallia populi]|uniref:transposase n=1 Tax=Actinocorallia populi TaxID=2079200 RepID=UPI000D08C0E5|nr:transposase [Actinocorallia populi]
MPKPYPPEFRRRALDLLESGRPVLEIAASLGIAESCLHRWKRLDLIERGLKAPSPAAVESAALAQAQAQARIAELENEVKILRKAAAAVEPVVPPKVRFALVAELADEGVPVTQACLLLRRPGAPTPAGWSAGPSTHASEQTWPPARLAWRSTREASPARSRAGSPRADHGTQFTSWTFTERARKAGLLPSLGTVGDPYDCETVVRRLVAGLTLATIGPLECLGVDLSAGHQAAPPSWKVRAERAVTS